MNKYTSISLTINNNLHCPTVEERIKNILDESSAFNHNLRTTGVRVTSCLLWHEAAVAKLQAHLPWKLLTPGQTSHGCNIYKNKSNMHLTL
jgi:hypothetical protein